MRPLTALVAAATCLLPALAFPAAESELLELPESAVQRQPGPPGEGSEPGEALFTNAVTYCAEAKAVLVDQFDIAYWNANNSVTFSFSFASIEPNLNVSASLFLNAYGNTIFNETIELCDLVAGVLCPLPMINFTGEQGHETRSRPSQLHKLMPQAMEHTRCPIQFNRRFPSWHGLCPTSKHMPVCSFSTVPPTRLQRAYRPRCPMAGPRNSRVSSGEQACSP